MRGVPGAPRGPVTNPVRSAPSGHGQQGQRHGGQRPAPGGQGGNRPGGGQRRRGGGGGGGQRRAG